MLGLSNFTFDNCSLQFRPLRSCFRRHLQLVLPPQAISSFWLQLMVCFGLLHSSVLFENSDFVRARTRRQLPPPIRALLQPNSPTTAASFRLTLVFYHGCVLFGDRLLFSLHILKLFTKTRSRLLASLNAALLPTMSQGMHCWWTNWLPYVPYRYQSGQTSSW
ncbi:uncharacterized protein LOC112198265 isoform X2 [Rosa chinensis]|uniref:uncharacterized protein LOC112198265 isoform X2 n=1 Tax=Rosa chinensis TaxID=74649 RepID=UPI001AD8BE31|nr:uncharacterized protein LOC112198265 isoform X2 [Rosa chinensis]